MTQRQLLEARECDCRNASGRSGLRRASGVWPRDAEPVESLGSLRSPTMVLGAAQWTQPHKAAVKRVK